MRKRKIHADCPFTEEEIIDLQATLYNTSCLKGAMIPANMNNIKAKSIDEENKRHNVVILIKEKRQNKESELQLNLGVACANTGRNFIGIELDENYFNIASKRIKEAQQQLKLF